MLVVIIPVQKLVSGCREACLFTAGRGAFSNVMNARIRKTKLFFEQKDEFLSTLKNDLTLFSRIKSITFSLFVLVSLLLFIVVLCDS